MIKIGLSGNRFSGKDRITKLFKQIHVPVFDADTVLRFIIHYNAELLQELKLVMSEYYFDHGNLNMKRVKEDGKFSDVVYFFKQEIFDAYEAFNIKNKNSIYSIFHSSILFEADWFNEMDANICVFAPSNVRIDRCKFVSDYKTTDIYKLLKTEIDDLDKNKLSTYIIHNYEPNDILNRVCDIDKQIIDSYLYSKITVDV